MQTIQFKSQAATDLNQRWKRELAEAVNSVPQLLSMLGLEHLQHIYTTSEQPFRLRVPHAYIAKMQHGNIDDPLLRQVLPDPKENTDSGLLDPVGDLSSMTTPGLLHKYNGRVLLVTTGACAIHCRYCFRRHFPYSDNCKQSSLLQNTLQYIENDTSIHEIILSGGDPLTLDDERLSDMCEQLESIEHLKWLRIHTRLPVVLPSRINHSLLRWINKSRFRITMVIHANHANELGVEELEALNRLQQAGVTLLNQSVLLKNINDNIASITQLSQRLHDCGVVPYYLHLLDPVKGAMHYDVDQATACQLIEAMRNQLPGFLIPRLVREENGKDSKTAIFSS